MSSITPDASLQIRPAAPVDVARICEMIHELADYERQAGDCHATPEALGAQLFPTTGHATVQAIVARLEDEPAGFALYFFNFSTWECAPGLYLEDVYVRPAHRRKGVGQALLRHLARVALERGCRRFELSVLDWNQPAIDFYRSLGAAGMDGWTVQRIAGEALWKLGEGGEGETSA